MESLRHILHRTDPDRVPDYHQRAAYWYEQQGWIAEAIQHAISAQSFEYAAHLIEQEIQTSENLCFDAIVPRRALDKLPAQLTNCRSWLLVAKAGVGFTSSQFAEAIAAIQTLERYLKENSSTTENTDQFWGLIIALKGMQARQQGNIAESTQCMEKALKLLPQDNSWLRSLILLNLGLGLKGIFGISMSANLRVSRLAERYGFQVSCIQSGSDWMRMRGWSQIEWQLTRESWEHLFPSPRLC